MMRPMSTHSAKPVAIWGISTAPATWAVQPVRLAGIPFVISSLPAVPMVISPTGRAVPLVLQPFLLLQTRHLREFQILEAPVPAIGLVLIQLQAKLLLLH